MRILCLLPAVVLSACTVTPTPIRPLASPTRSASLPAALLDAHNRERAAAGQPAFTWDPILAAGAVGHARNLAAIGGLRHSPRSARPGQGENLWMGSRGAFSAQQMVGDWASERRWFRSGLFPAVSRTGNWADVGHYSQIIWPTTTRLGCALASSARLDVLVCRYAPAGNIDGRRVP